MKYSRKTLQSMYQTKLQLIHLMKENTIHAWKNYSSCFLRHRIVLRAKDVLLIGYFDVVAQETLSGILFLRVTL